MNIREIFDYGFNIKNSNYDMTYLAIVANISLIFVLTIFAYANLFIKDNITLATIEILFVFLTLGVLVYFKKYADTKIFLLLSTTVFFLISLLFYIFIQKVLFSAVWLFFFPFIAYLLNGLRIGFIFTTLYLAIIIIYSYLGVGVYTDFVGFLHIAISLSLFSFFVHQFEKSRKKAYKKMVEALNHLEDISYKDELTKLYNRHFLNTEILQNSTYHNKPFMFCITDIDNFKLYNDTYGHQKGDETLKVVAEIKKQSIGDTDNHFVIRLGGEEFGGFIFDSTNPKESIDTFFEKLKNINIEHKENKPYEICTISMGAVICHGNNKFDFTKIYQLADEALYEAKKNGKNQVVYKNFSDELISNH